MRQSPFPSREMSSVSRRASWSEFMVALRLLLHSALPLRAPGSSAPPRQARVLPSPRAQGCATQGCSGVSPFALGEKVLLRKKRKLSAMRRWRREGFRVAMRSPGKGSESGSLRPPGSGVPMIAVSLPCENHNEVQDGDPFRAIAPAVQRRVDRGT